MMKKFPEGNWLRPNEVAHSMRFITRFFYEHSIVENLPCTMQVLTLVFENSDIVRVRARPKEDEYGELEI